MQEKELLKFITCGSVDDGKSTLIGHMLYSAKLLYADQRQALELDSVVGSAGGAIDYSLLLDGLESERQQGITIDVAYRYFSTDKRSFIVADTPGHEEYTRNMAVGASFAELAVILVDAQKGIQTQTKRHIRICAFMGIRDFIFAVNKIDLVHYNQSRLVRISQEIQELMQDFSVHSLRIIPVSASVGDNITESSANTPWYTDLPLLTVLETVRVASESEDKAFCLPIQRVSRPNHTFRGFQGQIAAGEIRLGDKIQALPSGEAACISRILSAGKEVDSAAMGEPVTVCLDKEIDITRGSVLTNGGNLCVGNAFAGTVLWTDGTPLCINKPYTMQIGTNSIHCRIQKICSKSAIDSGENVLSTVVGKNEIALCEIVLEMPLAFDTFTKSAALGGFILIDRITNATAACGIVEYPLNEEGRPVRQAVSINRVMRENRNGHKALTVWLTGLSGAGKSTIADSVEKVLFQSGVHTMILDGDNTRLGLCRDLGFSDTDRSESIRRVSEMAKILNDAGITVITSFISPFEADRSMARQILGDSYIEVYVNASLETCIQRDTKGLYKKALRGEIKSFTGISSRYEPPENPNLTVYTDSEGIEACTQAVVKIIQDNLWNH